MSHVVLIIIIIIIEQEMGGGEMPGLQLKDRPSKLGQL